MDNAFFLGQNFQILCQMKFGSSTYSFLTGQAGCGKTLFRISVSLNNKKEKISGMTGDYRVCVTEPRHDKNRVFAYHAKTKTLISCAFTT